nr:thiamine pyrophosphate-dependent dehydrogenase E1 component subunit alpha [Candidatus Sigynarchaeota archaeon]
MMQADTSTLYSLMIRSRLFEEAVKQLWDAGNISGEMHLGIGEEAVIAGVVSQLTDGDAMALDHRGTAALLMRGVDPLSILLECMGHARGMCAGQGGHMHLFSKDHLAASSGIVGSAGPAAAGFAIAAKYKKSDKIAVAFFGEGAMNQGMMLESLNLAAAWKLPVLFVCKDNGWAISTQSKDVTGGNLVDRAKGFGIEAVAVDGMDVEAVWKAAFEAILKIRSGNGPFFIQAKCEHREGHFLGDPLLRFHEAPIKNYGQVLGPLMKALFSRKGASMLKRSRSMGKVLSLISLSGKQRKLEPDPVDTSQKKQQEDKLRLDQIKEAAAKGIGSIVQQALEITKGGRDA